MSKQLLKATTTTIPPPCPGPPPEGFVLPNGMDFTKCQFDVTALDQEAHF